MSLYKCFQNPTTTKETINGTIVGSHAVSQRAQLAHQSDWQMIVRDANGRPDRGMDGSPVAWGATNVWWSKRRGKRLFVIFLSDCSSKYYIRYCELQHCTTQPSDGWTWHFRWSTPTLISENNLLVNMGEWLEDENYCKWLFWQKMDTLFALIAEQYFVQFCEYP